MGEPRARAEACSRHAKTARALMSPACPGRNSNGIIFITLVRARYSGSELQKLQALYFAYTISKDGLASLDAPRLIQHCMMHTLHHRDLGNFFPLLHTWLECCAFLIWFILFRVAFLGDHLPTINLILWRQTGRMAGSTIDTIIVGISGSNSAF